MADPNNPPVIPISLEKWLQRIEDKQIVIDDSVRIGMQSIRNQIETLEKSLPDRFLTRREWDVVLEAGKINREAQEALFKANNERHVADQVDIETRLRSLEGHGWWIAGAFGVALLSFAANLFIHGLSIAPHP